MDNPIDLIEQEIPRLRRFARYLTRNAQDADDLVQDCLATAIAKIHLWAPGTNMRAWLFTILRNLHITERRRAMRAPLLTELNDRSLAATAHPRQELHLAVQDVEAAFEHLSEEHREVLLLVAVEGLSYEQAAEIMGTPIGTVRSRLSRARDALRHQLEQMPPRTQARPSRPDKPLAGKAALAS